MPGQLNQFAALNNVGWDAALVLAEGAEQFGRLQCEAAKILQQAAAGSALALGN